jgi:hypothetical protein
MAWLNLILLFAHCNAKPFTASIACEYGSQWWHAIKVEIAFPRMHQAQIAIRRAAVLHPVSEAMRSASTSVPLHGPATLYTPRYRFPRTLYRVVEFTTGFS